jgi:uncharacterized repeat protein (TIGR01451 family)
MVARRSSIVLALVLSLLAPLVLAASENTLTGSIEAFRVVTTDNGEDFLPAEEASPNDVIEYRLTYKNTGEEPVRNIFITDPIPAGTEYVSESAAAPANGEVEFSIDGGKSFHAWPISLKRLDRDGNDREIEATPDMVTHIRWIVTDTFKPDGEITVSYRTTIK